MQYFNLQSRTLGAYGYEWTDSNGEVNHTNVGRFLILNVTRYVNATIDPTYINVGVEGNTPDGMTMDIDLPYFMYKNLQR